MSRNSLYFSIVISLVAILSTVVIIWHKHTLERAKELDVLRYSADLNRVRKLAMATADYINAKQAYPSTLDDIIRFSGLSASDLNSSLGSYKNISPPYYLLVIDRKVKISDLTPEFPVVSTRSNVLSEDWRIIGYYDGGVAKIRDYQISGK